MYTHGPFMLTYGKNHHNIIKQLSFNFLKKELSSYLQFKKIN